MTTIQQTQGSVGSRASRKGTLIGIAAAALAATAVINGYQARRAERRNPPKGRFVDVDGVRLHYLEKGAGPPVVLIHGNIVSAEDFAHSGLLDLLATHHRVIAFDRPGMGYSDRPRGTVWTPTAQATLLQHAFDALGIERPVVLGHSLGAMVAVALGLDHPEAVSGLVLLGGYYYPTARADVALAAPPAIPVLGDVLRYTVSPLVGAALLPAFIKGMFAPCPIPARFIETFAPAMALRPWQIRAMAEDGAMMIGAAAAVDHRYRELTMPVAILAGAEDKAADVARQSARLHTEIPHSTLNLVPNVGHMVHYAVPGEVLSAIDTMTAPAAGPKADRTVSAWQ
ncbi:alpha/beta fold hydrolase [Azospirillum sp. sgz301742]